MFPICFNSRVTDRVLNEFARSGLESRGEVEVGRLAGEASELLPDLYVVEDPFLADGKVVSRGDLAGDGIRCGGIFGGCDGLRDVQLSGDGPDGTVLQ